MLLEQIHNKRFVDAIVIDFRGVLQIVQLLCDIRTYSQIIVKK